jgi:uncharacterized protein YoaH (UPF0181 family)
MFMSKRYIKASLERDAYLSRHESKEATLQNLQRTVERLSKLMPMSKDDKEELLVYAEQLTHEQSQQETAAREKRNEVLAEPTANSSRQDNI